MIFVKEASVRGLTTAAGLWSTAAVGMAMGAGMYAVSLFVTMLIIVLQFVLHSAINCLEGTVSNLLRIRMRYSPQVIERLRGQMAAHQMHIEFFRVKKASDNTLSCTFTVRMPREMTYDEWLFLLDENEDVIELDM